MPPLSTLYCPDLLMAEGRVIAGGGLLVGADGLVAGYCAAEAAPDGTTLIAMRGKALLPGLANVHSHTFQRLFRGRAEGRAVGGDSFWTWREQMYRAAAFVSPEDIYDVARATFLEMVSAGITVVGEFHYLHRDPSGLAYDEPNLLANLVIAAAQSVGLRICLLRSAYFRAGHDRPFHDGQKRFYETAGEYLRNLSELAAKYRDTPRVTVGAALHSIRAVPLVPLKEIAQAARAMGNLPLHLHISEQIAENAACWTEYGSTPVRLMEQHGILSPQTTLVHATHVLEPEYAAIAASQTTICCCPTTERNLGDGIFPADVAGRLGVPIAFGTDSQAQIDLLEDARQLEYHLRLRDQRRGILDGAEAMGFDSESSARELIGQRLFRAASGNGYQALGLTGGGLRIGQHADFFTVDLNDFSILGLSESDLDAESIAAQIVFGLSKSAVRDVAVAGRVILCDGQHAEQEAIRSRYRAVQLRYGQPSAISGEPR